MRGRLPAADVLLIVLLASGSAVAVLRAGGASAWLALGALSWGAALAMKIPLSGLAGQFLRQAGAVPQAVAQGAVSAATELGVAWAAFEYVRLMPASFFDFVGFAVGAGSVEALGVLAWALFAPHEETPGLPPTAWLTRHAFAVERALAWLGQLGSRLLLCATRVLGWAWPLTVAFTTFAATDGLAAYGHARGWDWSQPRMLGGYYLAAGTLLLAEFGALAYLWQTLR